MILPTGVSTAMSDDSGIACVTRTLVNAPLVASAVLGDPALTTLFLGKSSHVLPIARGQDESTLATEWVNVQA